MTKFKQQQQAAVAAFEAKIEEINKKGKVQFTDIIELNTVLTDYNLATFMRNKYATVTERENIIAKARAESMELEIESIRNRINGIRNIIN